MHTVHQRHQVGALHLQMDEALGTGDFRCRNPAIEFHRLAARLLQQHVMRPHTNRVVSIGKAGNILGNLNAVAIENELASRFFSLAIRSLADQKRFAQSAGLIGRL